MPVIILPEKWRNQPKGRLALDDGNHICVGIRLFQSGGYILPLTDINGVTLQSDKGGVSRYYTATSSQYLRADSGTLTGAPLTFGAIAERASAGEHSVLTLGSNSSSDFHRLYIHSTNFPRMESQAAGVSTSSASTISAGTARNALVGIVPGSSYRRVYINGVGSTADTTSSSPAEAGSIVIGAKWVSGAASNFFNGPIPLAVVWGRELSEAEITDWSYNPWQIFKKAPKVLYFDVPTPRPAPPTPSAPSGFPAIVLPERWKEQPIGTMELDAEAQLAKGVVAYQSGQSIAGWNDSGLTPSLRKDKEITRYYTRTNVERLSKDITLAPPLTMGAIFRRASTGAAHTILASSGTTGTYSYHRMDISAANVVQMISGYSTYSASTGPGIGSGVRAICVGVVGSATFRQLYTNGIPATANTDSHVPSGLSWISIGATMKDGIGSAEFDGAINLGVFWNRMLSEEEIREWSSNPWQIFKKSPRILRFIPPLTTKALPSRAM